MFEDKLDMALNSYGMTEEVYLSLLRDEPFLSDNKIFAISRLINKTNPNVILTKNIGKLVIVCKRFDIAIDYVIKSSNPCTVAVDFINFGLDVKYKDLERKLVIDQNLMDYQGEHSKLIDLRQLALNEIMIRYFSKILITIHNELGWYR